MDLTSVITRRETCRMCAGKNLELVFSLAPSPIGDAYVTKDQLDQIQDCYPIDLFLCQDCGLSQLLDIIAPELLYRDYIYLTGSSHGLAEHFRSYVTDMLEQFLPPAESLVVDIGSNDGTLLGFFQERGLRTLGIDPAHEIAGEVTCSGIETLPEFFTPELAQRIHREHGPAVFITANNVIANIDDLGPIAEGIHILLAEDGVFSFESFYLADVVQNMVFDFIYHEHLSAFSVRPVRSFFNRSDMELFDVKHVPTKGGSLRYMVQRSGSTRPLSPDVDAFITREEEMGLYRPETFRTFADQVDGLKAETSSLLKKLRGEGKSIAGFGASVTGTTLIYHFDIGEYLDYLVDDNPAKHDRFSPGLHLPVYPGEALLERQPDYTVILAWRFAEQVVNKYTAYLAQGGRFIVPVPEMRII